MRPKRFDRISRQFNIDKDLDEWLRTKYTGVASEKVNELLRGMKDKEDKTVNDLISINTAAGRMAYSQAMEKLGYPINTGWKSLSLDDQLNFLKLYKTRLIDLQQRGFL